MNIFATLGIKIWGIMQIGNPEIVVPNQNEMIKKIANWDHNISFKSYTWYSYIFWIYHFLYVLMWD